MSLIFVVSGNNPTVISQIGTISLVSVAPEWQKLLLAQRTSGGTLGFHETLV